MPSKIVVRTLSPFVLPTKEKVIEYKNQNQCLKGVSYLQKRLEGIYIRIANGRKYQVSIKTNLGKNEQDYISVVWVRNY